MADITFKAKYDKLMAMVKCPTCAQTRAAQKTRPVRPVRPVITTTTTIPNLTIMITMATMTTMTMSTMRKLEVVHKEVGGCLISYNQLWSRKVVGGYLTRSARFAALIALNDESSVSQ